MTSKVRHKVFITYHHDDQDEVDDFIRTYDEERDVFIRRVVGGDMASDIQINSGNPAYVMRRIRELYLRDSTVTIVFIGKCTSVRRYVDWEIASSLRQGPSAGLPNGLLAILEPSRKRGNLPERFKDNWDSNGTDYGRFYQYPVSKTQLASWIEDAFDARTSRAQLITNGRALFQRNRTC